MTTAGYANTQLVTHAEPTVHDLGCRKYNRGSALRVGELIARILFENYGARSNGCDDRMGVEGELSSFVDKLGYASGRPPSGT
jgi:hypothetical protein